MADGPAGRQRLPPPIRLHLDALTGPHGIYQHARGSEPDPAHGTCTDDVARALGVDLLHARILGWPAVAVSARRSLDYLLEAFDEQTGRFRNFRSDEGTWLPGEGSQDCHGRAMLALGEAAAAIPEPERARDALAVLARACPAAGTLSAARAIAWGLLACIAGDAASSGSGRAGGGAGVARDGAPPPMEQIRSTLARLADRLEGLVGAAAGTRWPWPEPSVTYESPLVPRALLVAGAHLDRPRLVDMGREVLDWLIATMVDADQRFHPVGNRGWWPQGGLPARFDQQPIEAGAMVAAAATAWEVLDDPTYVGVAEAAFAWFSGRNDLEVGLAIPEAGACRDGLGPGGPNLNQGAESTLVWLTAVERIRRLRSELDGQRIGSVIDRGSGIGHDLMYSRMAR